jgi:hypothetical protein
MNVIFEGSQFKVELTNRGIGDKHVEIIIYIEDDGNWFEKMRFSSFWLKELMGLLWNASKYLKTSTNVTKDRDGYGYEFKEI